MLPQRVARLRLGRATLGLFLRRQNRGFISSQSSSSSLIRNIAIAGGTGAGASGIWWSLKGTPDRDHAPDLNDPPTGELTHESGSFPDNVSQILAQGAYSFQLGGGTGVNRYDGTQLASNDPCEDRYLHGRFPSPWDDGSHWMAFAVLDGHVGAQTAELLERKLVPFVRHSLAQVKPPSVRGSVPEESVQSAIVDAFVSLDDSIVKTASEIAESPIPLAEKIRNLALANAGSCALLSLFDPATSTLHVACTGDSRAVLGQMTSDGIWETIPLSVDQTGSNEEEIVRLKKKHPGEDKIVEGGRVLGMMVSRAFGDARWKWPLELQQDLKRKFETKAPLTPRYDVRTPPYLTAEPVATSTKIDPTKPSFLIMATDGLWDMLSSQQAVGLIGEWLQPPTTEKNHETPKPDYKPFNFSQLLEDVDWRFVEERTTVQDDNAAVHLVRNSLGGNHHEMLAGRLAFSAPFSRDIRDDVTVQVVFFNTPEIGTGRRPKR